LGVLTDDSLQKPQIKNLCSKVASGSWALYYLRQYLDSNALMLVYHIIIHSHLNYCISSLRTVSPSIKAPLETLQKRAVRTITFNNPKTHSQQIFLKLQVLKLGDIFTLEIGKIMYKIHKSSNIFSFGKLALVNQIHTYHIIKGATTGG